jgi:hypothetical protein
MINLSLLKDLIAEIEKTKIDLVDTNKAFIEKSKLIGLLGGVVSEATILINEVAYSTNPKDLKETKETKNSN